MGNPDSLTFEVAPHIVEDLGLNLYTNLPRVLVEFIANAHDADSLSVDIGFDATAIKNARTVMKKEHELEKVRCEQSGLPAPDLATKTLPGNLQISIEDAGHGMSRNDLKTKFLIAGRRRRTEDGAAQKHRTASGRPLMGRKGLGKLAGFGVAKRIEITSKIRTESHATKITLEFDKIIKARSVNDYEIPEEKLKDGGGFASGQGTRIVLSHLMYDPLTTRALTLENEIAELFEFIKPEDFAIRINAQQIKPFARKHAFSWPDPDHTPPKALVSKTLTTEFGEITFQYRIRFTEDNNALEADKRGVRIYTHNRLAAAPSLLKADTNMHGFRMTDYMDGVVQADFIDEQDADYVATDRQSLRWEAPLLQPLEVFLSGEIKEAAKQYQKKRDDVMPGIVKNDNFTKEEIEKHEFSSKDRRMALRFATVLASSCKGGIDDPAYKTKLAVLIPSIGQGNIMSAISELADQDHPNLHNVATEIARLTKGELDQFIGSVKARIKAIEAFKKVVKEANFQEKQNEKTVQKMFEKAPWIIDPTYFEFLTADTELNSVFDELAKELKIAKHATAPQEEDDKRPDLVFLLGNEGLSRLVIIELKSANTQLVDKHLGQLEYYMEIAEQWMAEHGHAAMKIEGHLIGSRAPVSSRAQGVVTLNSRIKKAGPQSMWKVRSFLEILEDTEAAHKEVLKIHRSNPDSIADDKDD